MSSSMRRTADSDPLFEAKFSEEINKKMRVPKHILGSGKIVDGRADNHWINPMDLQHKYEMHVPDRILVAGEDQHIGSKAMPREIQLEKAMMPVDPGLPRVETPPRVITLDKHFIPGADEMMDSEELLPDYKPPPPIIATRNGPMVLNGGGDYNSSMKDSSPHGELSMSQLSLSPAEERMMLRKQVLKLNRRVFAIENEIAQQQQREKIIIGLGLAYFLIKSVIWLTRSPS